MLLSNLKENYIFKKKAIIFPIGIALILIMTFVVWSGMLLTKKTIYSGVFIENLNMAGLDLERSKNLLENHIKALYGNVVITVKYKENSWRVNPDDIDFKFSTENALKEAYSFGRTGSVFQRLRSIIDLEIKEVNIPAEPVFDKNKLYSVLSNIKSILDVSAKSASVTYKNGKILIYNETTGKLFDIDRNIDLVNNELAVRNFNNINLIVGDVLPPIVYNNIKEINGVLGSFTTAFNPGDTNRTSNIKLACERINGIILMPAEVFSMNKALGPRTIENGYKDAKVIYKNELIEGPGGGVCQVSTTLYGAVLRSRAQVVERTPHSMPLGYVEPGQDATIAGDYIDFKFKNNFSYPIAISAEVAGRNLYIRILGKKDIDTQTVRLRSVVVEQYEADGEEIVVDDSLTDSERHIVSEAKKGLRVLVYREIYDKNGQMVQKEKISDNDYKPVKAKVKVSQNYFNIYKALLEQ